MYRFVTYAVSLITVIVLGGCRDSNLKSPIPSFPVRISIDTRSGAFVNFKKEYATSYVIIDKEGYHFNDVVMPLRADVCYGYAGVVVYVTNASSYVAFDLCCPHCLEADHPLLIDGMYAACPICGEEYELISGFGMPSKGISRYNLLRYSVSVTNSIIYVSN